MKRIVPIFAALLLTACSSVPDALQVADEDALVPYSAALEQPQSAVGKTARWGGVVAEVRNSDNGTVIEVVNFDLHRWGRPLTSDQSQGRFRAKLSGFVDPMVWKQGSSVTFVGTVAEPETGTIDEYTYLFPVLNVSSKYLWPVRKEPTRVEVNYDALWYRHYWYTRPAYPRPIYYPGPVMEKGSKQNKDN
ncbi:Slp family lipoprotein [Pseudidiomarina marina]|uniref:Starvation-inducible protein n=1 Tax=Pseudidiomarina marina TaxID=502366 RepID=A0A432YKD2_9GAMM|nr:Slp family lipoprotein [Pseudidiomarina marina]RUO61437.1 starvation-inducible protein [Pseudidiomarina marina]